MANTKAQRNKISQEIGPGSSFYALERKWKKRRAEKGTGRDVLDQEFEEWLFIEAKRDARENRVANYLSRCADRIWNDAEFQRDIMKAQQIYLENIKLPREQQ